HEWLWRFSPDAAAVRDANRLLHSRQAYTMGSTRLRAALENLGLRLDNGAVRPLEKVIITSPPGYQYSFDRTEIRVNPHWGADIVIENRSNRAFILTTSSGAHLSDLRPLSGNYEFLGMPGTVIHFFALPYDGPFTPQ